MSLCIASIEQAGEVFHAFPGEPGLPLPLSLHPAFGEFAVITGGQRMEKRVLGWGVSLEKDKRKSEDAVPAAGPIMRSLPLARVRRKINAVLEVISHILPEVVVDSSLLLNGIKRALEYERTQKQREGFSLTFF